MHIFHMIKIAPKYIKNMVLQLKFHIFKKNTKIAQILKYFTNNSKKYKYKILLKNSEYLTKFYKYTQII